MLLKAHERRVDDRLFLRWAIHHQHEMSFEEFKSELTPRPQMSTKEIIADVNSIISDFNRAGFKEIAIDGNI